MLPEVARAAARWQHVTDELVALAHAIPSANWDQPSACDGWTNKELLIHLATGYVARIERFESVLAGRAPQGITDIDAVNAHNVEALRNATIDAIIDTMVETRGRMRSLIEQLRPERLRTAHLNAAALDDLSAHDLEHAAELKLALAV